MPFVQAKCPNCGGFLAVDNAQEAAVCQFCNTPFIVEKAINNYNITVNGNINVERATVNVEGAPSVSNLLIRAKSFIASEDYSKAVEYFNRVLDLDPNNIDAKSGITSLTVPNRANLIIERESAFSCGPRKARIYVDGKELGKVKDGETISFLVPLGAHTISFKLASFKVEEKRFFLPSALQYAKVTIKAKLNSLSVQGNVLNY